MKEDPKAAALGILADLEREAFARIRHGFGRTYVAVLERHSVALLEVPSKELFAFVDRFIASRGARPPSEAALVQLAALILREDPSRGRLSPGTRAERGGGAQAFALNSP